MDFVALPELFAIDSFKIFTDSPIRRHWEYSDIQDRYGPCPEGRGLPTNERKSAAERMKHPGGVLRATKETNKWLPIAPGRKTDMLN